ncbi:MAG: hypothetical protein GWM98_16970, partial [Nitrospinaceae bacterium]|nr:hypothetical protein [Nitrospinaceae bacterium]NIR55871.1 hypothetical protein [Nitrospinaceae bacterium]NIS86323.1 hypothetical protein [Nitrospinaceae bacterium]NIT83153.1 hypothetical protein [Nitrospinaceae bacterium]NIU45362.1 hypothetical protein [Nitrospinaceae bacterium]
RDAWVKPYAVRIFVAGDNDLPPQRKKSRDSGCWEKIAPLATRFDTPPKTGPQPGEREGYITLENTLFVVLDALDWRDPAPWLQPVITDARRRDLWIVFALHVPAVTTAWYKEKRQTVLKDINQLRPDLVLAGNQHAYERFYPMGLPRKNGALPVVKKSVYPRGTGVTHVVSGGGGAKIKPFADLQDVDKRTAPDAVLDALAKRALMFNYLTLDISHDHFKVQAYRVCPPPPAPEDAGDPRWHADDDMWKSVPLACDGKPPGVAPFDQFEITR